MIIIFIKNLTLLVFFKVIVKVQRFASILRIECQISEFVFIETFF